ncbi:MAG: hypothetical protein ABI432_07675 [Flavobacteriales bacterium]
MKSCIFLSCCLVVLSVSSAAGQNAIQYRLDTTAAETDPVVQTCVTADGGSVFVLQTTAGEVLWKGGSDGTPQWALLLDSALRYPGMEARSNGGLLIAEDMGREHFGGLGGPDTIVQHIALSALSVNGELNWRTSFSLTLPGFEQWTGPLQELQVTEDPSGSIFLFATRSFESSISQVAFVFKFSSEGDLLWSRRIGEDYAGAGVVWNLYSGDQLAFQPDGSGGGYFMAHAYFYPGHLMHLDVDGALDWTVGYTYENDFQTFVLSNMAVDADGNAVMAGKLNVPVGGLYSMIVRISPVGELVDADIYSWSNASLDLTGIFRTSADRLMLWWTGYFLEVDINGVITQTKRIEGASVPPHNFAFYPKKAQWVADRLVLPGTMNITHQVFGYSNNQPQVWSFDLADLDGCLFGDFDVVQYDVPDSLVLVVPDPANYVSVDAPVLMESNPFGSTGVTPMNTSEACSMFVGLPEGESVPLAFMLMTNLVYQGDALTIRSSSAANFNLVNSAGAVVGRIARTGEISRIGTSGLGAGLYLIVGYDRSGSPLGTARVMIQ